MKRALFAIGLSILVAAPVVGQPALSDADIEQFLLNAKVVKTRSAGKGLTNTIRATLTDGTLTHDVHIQTIDERRARAETKQGIELNFRDSWKFNVAAYRLDRLIGLNMVPVSVPRRHGRDDASYTWWVDDVLVDEEDRLKRKLKAPDAARWQEQMDLLRVFDQLIYNVDRNLGNVLITRDWRVWLIDHSRAFRLHKDLKAPRNIATCDRQVLDGMKQLTREGLIRDLGGFVTEPEIDALLARRDLIVAQLERAPEKTLFDRSRP
jgi:hypothetical protein